MRLLCSGSDLVPTNRKLDKIANESGLFERKPRKISAQILLGALMASIAFNGSSCRAVALAIGVTKDIKISRVAVWRLLRKRAIVVFLESLIAHALKNTLKISEHAILKIAKNAQESIPGVNRILVGDATSICLHPSLHDVFPGSKNQTDVPKSHLKIQLIVDLLSGQFVDISLDPYQRSDGKAAYDFIPEIQEGDLLIRDLGYCCMGSFLSIIESDAFFISRLKTRVHILDPEGSRIELLSRLNTLAPNPGDTARISILMSESDQVPCDLIAIRVPEEVANQRRADLKAKHAEQSWPAPGKEYLARQDWTLLVTNLPKKSADNQKVRELYLMRWRIENIFKACKSHSGLLKVASHKTNGNHAKALILTWMLLMMILADRGVFSMARLREVICPSTHESYQDLEIHNLSLFKSLQKQILTVGFYLELIGCDMDLMEHAERTAKYENIHNTTELIWNRMALSEILASALELEDSLCLC